MTDNQFLIKATDRQRLLAFHRSFDRLMTDCAADNYRQTVILCIGCDRSTGDALGPLVGSRLTHLAKYGVQVMGTLAKPVHALNLRETLAAIDLLDDPFVIAVDASLGRLDYVGSVVLRKGGLLPGAGVGKQLPEVGHVSISAIVNVGGFLEQQVLQSTSLYQVTQLAQLISQGLGYYFSANQARAII